MPNKLSPHGKTIVEGSVSWGTLRTQDLLRAFAQELEAIKPFGEHGLLNEARDYAEQLDDPHAPSDVVTDAQDVLEELIAILQSAAPDDMYFGAHEGNWSDFGFWSTEEQDHD